MDSLGSLCSLDGGKGPRKSTGRKLTQRSRWIIGWSDRAERRQGLMKRFWGSGVSSAGEEDAQTPRGDRVVAV